MLSVDEDHVDGMVFRLAETREELEASFKLIHDVFVGSGYIDPTPSGMWLKLQDFLPQSSTFIAVHRGTVVGTMAAYPDSPLGLPYDSTFKEEFDALRAQGRRIAEVGSSAILREYRGRGGTMIMHMNKIMLQYISRWGQADDMVIAVPTGNAWVFQHVLGFTRISGVKPAPVTSKTEIVALRLDMHGFEDFLRRKYRRVPLRKKNLYRFYEHDSKSIVLPNRQKAPLPVEDIEYFLAENATAFPEEQVAALRATLASDPAPR
ncbi:N-acyl amino acid synthase FeeM domain-containing protein [Haliangium sp.]|uniref:N-acyl amino acid synthase FeeM domain-containing protein n=1 Tax=Haliangium sp. TaxID=2663208 RepID=UPI003D137F61